MVEEQEMPKHLYVIIILTFFVGFTSGVYGFFMARDTESNVESPVVKEGYEILMTMYGGCERIGCSSFRLLDDGTYLYLAPQGVREYARYEDEISPRQKEFITERMRGTSFTKILESTFVGTCPVTYDGIAYRFDIIVDGERYSMDSCTQDTSNEPLFIELIKYFDIMEATHRSS